MEVVLASLGGAADDQLELSRLIFPRGWSLRCFDDLESLRGFLRQTVVPVVIVHADSVADQWKSLLSDTAPAQGQPRPRLIVTARHADHQLWSEVLHFGGYNVLAKPFDQREVEWVVEHAILDWTADAELLPCASLSHLAQALRSVAETRPDFTIKPATI